MYHRTYKILRDIQHMQMKCRTWYSNNASLKRNNHQGCVFVINEKLADPTSYISQRKGSGITFSLWLIED